MAAALAALSTLALAPVAHGRGAVYRDPPSYHGIRKAPPTQAPKPPVPVSLSGTGVFPDVLVDEAGTAHIVWNEGRGDDADATMYCRLKRGATSCDASKPLLWDKSYGPGDGPQFNTDNNGPKIVRLGDQLVVFSKRYPTSGDKPDGTSSSTVVVWVSNDGGTSWSDARIVGKWDLGQLLATGPDDDPTILNAGVDPLCNAPGPASFCIEAYKSGQYARDAGNLTTGKDQNYYPALALDGDQPLASVTDLSANAHLRRYKGSGSYIDPNNWTQDTVLPDADELSLAGGPAGAYVMRKPFAGGAFSVSKLGAQPDGSIAVGPSEPVSDADSQFGRLIQGPTGKLFAAWQRRGPKDPGVVVRSGGGGSAARLHAAAATKPSFGTPQLLEPGTDNGQIALAAAADGGGFTVFNHTGFVNSPGEIVASGFGTTASTGSLGLGDLEGGGDVGAACQKVSFGKFTIDATEGCFLHGTGSKKRQVVTAGEIDIEGLRIIPDDGTKLVIDPVTLRLDTVGGDASVVLSAPGVGDVTLYHGSIARDLSKVVPGTDLFEFPKGNGFDPKVFGFDVLSDIPVTLKADGVHIPIDLKLPAAFGGFSGHAELVADAQSGLHVDSIHIHIGPLPLGVMVLNSLDIDYSKAGDIWQGDGLVTVPAGGKIAAHARFEMGDFKEATISFTPTTPIPIGPFVYLLSINGGFAVDPVHITAGAVIGAGAAVQGVSPVSIDGKFEMTFPDNGPADFRMSGNVNVAIFGIGNGFLDFQSDGYAGFGGHTGLSLGPLSLDADMDGFIDATTGTFGASLRGRVDVCFDFGIKKPCAGVGADAAVSSAGFAACGHVDFGPLGTFNGGIKFPTADFSPVVLANPVLLSLAILKHVSLDCHTDGFRVPPPRARHKQAGGGTAVAVAGGLPTETIAVEGDGGVPDVSVTGPGGETIAFGQDSPAGAIAKVDGVDAEYVLLKKPAAGDWTVTPAAGSPAVKQIMLSDGYTPAVPKAKLGGRGRARTIAYQVTGLGHNQTVEFTETGSFGTHVIGTVSKARGTLRFKPAVARGGKRTVTALVMNAGLVTDSYKVGTYTAPGPPAPGAVKSLRARRKLHKVTVTWGGVSGAKSYVVRLSSGHGTKVAKLVPGRSHSVVFTAIRIDDKLKIDVRALAASMRGGPRRSVTVRPGRQ